MGAVGDPPSRRARCDARRRGGAILVSSGLDRIPRILLSTRSPPAGESTPRPRRAGSCARRSRSFARDLGASGRGHARARRGASTTQGPGAVALFHPHALTLPVGIGLSVRRWSAPKQVAVVRHILLRPRTHPEDTVAPVRAGGVSVLRRKS